MDKKDLARVLKEIGIALELTDSNPFRARSYLNAARAIEKSPLTLQQLLIEGQAAQLKGVGTSLMERLQEWHQTGTIGMHTELLAQIPEGLWEVLQVPGLGSKRVRVLYEVLSVTSLAELEYACHENRLLELKGFGPKMQQNVLAGLAEVKARRGQMLLPDALSAAEPLLMLLRQHPLSQRAELTGELRRSCPIVKQLEFVVSCNQPRELLASLEQIFPETIAWEIAQFDTRQGQTPNGLSVVVHVCRPEQFACTWWQSTGSTAHIEQALGHAGETIDALAALPDEQSIYSALGLTFVPPILREGEDEVRWAATGKMPTLVQVGDLLGTVHNHTSWSDGVATLQELAAAAEQIGWSYLGIADHSQTAVYAGGLTPERVLAQWQEIDQYNATGKVRLLKGIESDILPDGQLDYDDHLLAGFDYLVASVHSQLRQPAELLMPRLLKALRHPATTILGHPTNRLLLGRLESAVDMQVIITEAAQLGKALELNANPHRLDLDWRWCRQAKQAGVKIAINPDAHRVSGLQDVHFGLLMAQKAGLTKEDLWHYEQNRG
ncbi:MAG: PHP domain-containing protein [Bacillota bacterium]